MTPPKKVLVTGATGQIGYMTYKRLKEQPEKVRFVPQDRAEDNHDYDA